MTIYVRVFHSNGPLYGAPSPPHAAGGVRRATIARGDHTIRTVKRYDAADECLILWVSETGNCFRVTTMGRIEDEVLQTSCTQDGVPLCCAGRLPGSEWWIVLSHAEIPLERALPGYRPEGAAMVCVHDERYLAERDADETAARQRWLAAEQSQMASATQTDSIRGKGATA